MSMAKCAWCKGTGSDGPGGSPCDICGGDGHVQVPDPPTPCARCKGAGRMKNELTEQVSTCVGCKGTGWST